MSERVPFMSLVPGDDHNAIKAAIESRPHSGLVHSWP
jgi:hypothetical protein